jgi:hypothetical protein
VTVVRARYCVLVAVFAVTVGGCVPTAARKNARLEDGINADLTAGMQYVEKGEQSDGTNSAPTSVPHFEIDLEYAHRLDDGSGFAVQAKLPMNIVFTTLDFYYQVPDFNSKWFFGFGAEVGALPGVYAVATHYFDDSLYFSLTPRVLNAKERGERAVLINPQVAVGLAGSVDMSLFASFAHHTGRGFNFDVDLGGCDDGRVDYRTNYWLAGGSARF